MHLQQLVCGLPLADMQQHVRQQLMHTRAVWRQVCFQEVPDNSSFVGKFQVPALHQQARVEMGVFDLSGGEMQVRELLQEAPPGSQMKGRGIAPTSSRARVAFSAGLIKVSGRHAIACLWNRVHHHLQDIKHKT